MRPLQTNAGLDIIGDVHGCFEELILLLRELGYGFKDPFDCNKPVHESFVPHPERKPVFVGDILNRGPNSMEVYHLVRHLVSQGYALMVPGNHERRLHSLLTGKHHETGTGMARLRDRFAGSGRSGLIREFIEFYQSLPGHLVLSKGQLIVAHAGIRDRYVGVESEQSRHFCMCGFELGGVSPETLKEKLAWMEEFRGSAVVVFGHIPSREIRRVGNFYGIDTGCVVGGCLSCLRWPETEVVQVKAKRFYGQSRVAPVTKPRIG